MAVTVFSQRDEGLQPLQTQTQVGSPVLLQLIMCRPVMVIVELLVSTFILPLVVRVLN